ncbi:unnamed protein product [Laminaria digitata]
MVRGSNVQHATLAGAPSNAEGNALDVRISFGGENPYWCDNIVVDFSAITPVLLSWDIIRVVLIGSRNVQEENAGENGCSPLSYLPPGVIDMILEFSQPTLVRPPVDGGELQQGGEGEPGQKTDSAHWTVF